ncbi:MAG: TIGR04222 domain-containing membrane protein [Acidobacteriota bacterium]
MDWMTSHWFDVSGLEFLVWFVTVGAMGTAFVAFGIRWLLGRWAPSETQSLGLYETAYLAGGPKRAIETVLAELQQRNLIETQDRQRKRRVRVRPRSGAFNRRNELDPLELETLRALAVSATPAALRESLADALADLRRSLVGKQLWLGAAQLRVVVGLITLVAAPWIVVGLARLSQGVARGEPVGLLVVSLTLGGLAVVLALLSIRRTRGAAPTLRRAHGALLAGPARPQIGPLGEAAVPSGDFASWPVALHGFDKATARDRDANDGVGALSTWLSGAGGSVGDGDAGCGGGCGGCGG